MVALRGSVEVATKIGVADAIVDLVSTGSTLRVNGLRAVGTLIESQAILVGRAADRDDPQVQQVATALRAVTAGRRKRYLLLNAPTTALDAIVDLIPGLEAPTVVPLAEDRLGGHSLGGGRRASLGTTPRTGGRRRQRHPGAPDRAVAVTTDTTALESTAQVFGRPGADGRRQQPTAASSMARLLRVESGSRSTPT